MIKTEEAAESESLPSSSTASMSATEFRYRNSPVRIKKGTYVFSWFSDDRQPLKFNALSQLSKTASSSREPSLAKSTKSNSSEKRKSSLEQIVEEEIKRKRTQERKDYWLCENIVVKLTTRRLGDELWNKKGVVKVFHSVDSSNSFELIHIVSGFKELKDKHSGLLELFDDKHTRVQVDDVHVQTVLPALGRTVMVVNGPYRGSEATLNSIEESKNTAKIKLITVSLICEFLNVLTEY